MKGPKLSCQNAEYRKGMRIYCKAIDDYCGHVYWKACKGWWALSANAERCPMRKGGQGHEGQGAAGRSDPV